FGSYTVLMRRVLLLLCLCGALVIVGAVLLWPRNDEPVFQGRRLSEWLRVYVIQQNSSAGSPLVEAADAVHHIGTNAIPLLLRGIQRDADLSRHKSDFREVLDDLPPPIRNDPRFDSILTRPNATLALAGFRILGPEARSAVPDLTRLMNDSPSF